MQGFVRNFIKDLMFELDMKLLGVIFNQIQVWNLGYLSRGNSICKCIENMFDCSLEDRFRKF